MSRTDGLTLTGSTAGGNNVFVILLNPATATYTVDMIGTVDVTTDVDFSSGVYDFAGGNTDWNGFIPATEVLGGVFLDNNSPDLLLTPESAGLPFGTINTTANAGGVGGAGGSSGNNVGSLETFRIDFVTDLSGDPAGITYAVRGKSRSRFRRSLHGQWVDWHIRLDHREHRQFRGIH